MKFAWWTVFFLLIMTGIFIHSVWSHEKVHQDIYQSYGISSKIDWWGELPYYIVTRTEPINFTQCPADTCEMQQNMVENVGYQMQPVLILLGMGMLILIFISEQMLSQQRRFHQILLGKEE